MDDCIPFSDVIDLLQAKGWELSHIWRPYRVFTRPGPQELPILIEVDGGMVRLRDLERVLNQLRAAA